MNVKVQEARKSQKRYKNLHASHIKLARNKKQEISYGRERESGFNQQTRATQKVRKQSQPPRAW